MLISFILKETRHILRDPRTMLVLFGMPVVMMLLFGYAISTDVRNVRVAVVTASIDEASRQIVDRLEASPYFTIACTVPTPAEAEALMRRREVDMAVVFAPDFGRRVVTGNAEVQIITDGAEPNMAVMQSNYARGVISGAVTPGVLSVRLLYNPQMQSAYNFVPGIMGMLLLIICAMMTSVSIVREKERGTMEVLLVSPVRPLLVMLAKSVPYLVLSLLILAAILLLSAFVLHVPIVGSVASIVGVSLLYIFLALSFGLLVSVVAQTQLVAILVSAMLMLLPSILLSGMIYPVESMPVPLQMLSAVVPARWYVSAMRKLMVMGTGLGAVGVEIAVLSGMAALVLSLALHRFKERME